MFLKDEKYRNFVAGWGAGMMEILLLYPQNKVIFRQQLQGTTTHEVVAQVCPASCCFVSYLVFRLTAGSTEAILCPFERTQVLLQARAFNKRYRNTVHAMRSLARIGVTELYRGLSLVILRNGLSSAVYFDLRNPLRDLVVSKCTDGITNNVTATRISMRLATIVSDFVSGAILGAFLSTLFFPMNVVKQRMQATVGTPFRSSIEVFRIIWKERNGSLREFFRGAAFNFTRSLLSWGITNATYEILRHTLSK